MSAFQRISICSGDFSFLFSAFCFQLSVFVSDLLQGLPGEALLREGLADYRSGRCTIPACLVGMARPRLRRAGLITGVVASSFPEPERQLYRLLRQEGGDAYSCYNSLVRELVSFEQALDRRTIQTLKAESEKEK